MYIPNESRAIASVQATSFFDNQYDTQSKNIKIATHAIIRVADEAIIYMVTKEDTAISMVIKNPNRLFSSILNKFSLSTLPNIIPIQK